MAKPLEGLKLARAEKSSQSTVVYMTGDKGPFRCDHCEYFYPPHECSKVSGTIDPAGCCNLYSSNGK